MPAARIHELAGPDTIVDREHALLLLARSTPITAFIPVAPPSWRLAPRTAHWNGLAMVDGRPKYVTVGRDRHAGRLACHKAKGASDGTSDDEIFCADVPCHSPRGIREMWCWSPQEVWRNCLERAHVAHGARCGFNRGMIDRARLHRTVSVRDKRGLQRHSIGQRLRERTCGVWVVHIETAEIGFLRSRRRAGDIRRKGLQESFSRGLVWNDPRLAQSSAAGRQHGRVILPTEEEAGALAGVAFSARQRFYRKATDEAVAHRRALPSSRECQRY